MTNSSSLSRGSSQTVSEPEQSLLPEESVASPNRSIDSADQTSRWREKKRSREEEEEDEQRERKTKRKTEKEMERGETSKPAESRAVVGKPTLVARKALPNVQVKEITADRIECELTEKQLERIVRVYHIPETIGIVLPPSGWRASKPPQGYWCTYEDHLRGGLRLPLPDFIKTVLNFHGVPLAQVAPNGIRMLI